MVPSPLGKVASVGCICAVLSVWLSACQSHAPSTPIPARMLAEKTTAQCLDQMQNATTRPGGSRVVLTSAAFAVDDRLSIVPTDAVLDAAGQPANGRVRGPAESFRLTLNGSVCTMTRERDGQSTPLAACSCVAIP